MGVDTTVNGNLKITSTGTFNLNGKSLTVTGNFNSNGILKMQDAAGVLTVNGTTTINGLSETGLLTAGVLNVKGNFIEGSGCCVTNFDTSGIFKVAFTGTAAQSVTFAYGSAAGSHFRDLEIANSNGDVTFSNTTFVLGNLNITTPTIVSGPGALTIFGDLITGGGSAFSVT